MTTAALTPLTPHELIKDIRTLDRIEHDFLHGPYGLDSLTEEDIAYKRGVLMDQLRERFTTEEHEWWTGKDDRWLAWNGKPDGDYSDDHGRWMPTVEHAYGATELDAIETLLDLIGEDETSPTTKEKRDVMFPGTSDILIAIAAVSAMFIALYTGTTPGHAATFSIIAQGHSMTLNGPIEIGDAARLDQAYRQSCDRRGFCPERLFLDSGGGRVAESLRIADVVVQYALHTVVAKTAECFSSCFNIFAAGPLRVVFPGSTIGVHSLSDERGAETSDTLEWTRQMAEILRDLGVPPTIIAKLLATPPSGMAYLTADDVNGWVQWLD